MNEFDDSCVLNVKVNLFASETGGLSSRRSSRMSELKRFSSYDQPPPLLSTHAGYLVLRFSHTGYFEVEGCDGVNPTLLLTFNKTYIFDQSDISNHFHLIGFAYEADGAHVPVDELEPGIVPPGSGSDCDETSSCPSAMYWRNNEYHGKYSNTPNLIPIPKEFSDDFGLDDVEPFFKYPLGDWQEYGPFTTTLTFDVESFDSDLFYFNHVSALVLI